VVFGARQDRVARTQDPFPFYLLPFTCYISPFTFYLSLQSLVRLSQPESLLPEQSQTSFSHSRVIQQALIFFDLFQNDFEPQGRAVGTVGGHGLDPIGHGQNAGLQADLFPLSPSE